MKNSFKDKLKKRKYISRIEKNRKSYTNRNISLKRHKENKTTKRSLFLTIIIISLLFNVLFLLKIDFINNDNIALKEMAELNRNDYKHEMESLEGNYTNYLFLGDSITDLYNLDEYYEGLPVVNSGISGNTTEDILDDMKNRVYDYNPSKVFLLIGINDLGSGDSASDVFDNIKKIIAAIENRKPKVSIYIESVFPINKNIDDEKMISVESNDDVIELNTLIKEYCDKNNYVYINIYDSLTDDDGNFSEEYTDDGLHPNNNGYKVITEKLKKYLD